MKAFLIPAEAPQQASNTEVFQNHKTLSIDYYLKCAFVDSLSIYKASPKDEENLAKWFSTELKNLADNLDKLFKNPVPIEVLSRQQLADFRNCDTFIFAKKNRAWKCKSQSPLPSNREV